MQHTHILVTHAYTHTYTHPYNTCTHMHTPTRIHTYM